MFATLSTSYSPHPTAHAGQTALSLIVVIGGIVLLFSATLAFLSLSFLNSAYGFQVANRAEALAQGGMNDVMLQLIRYKDLPSGSYCIPLSCPADSVQMNIMQNTPVAGQVTVTADITLSRYRRKIQDVFSVNPTTGLVQILSSQQVPL